MDCDRQLLLLRGEIVIPVITIKFGDGNRKGFTQEISRLSDGIPAITIIITA
jgi:hypothetical protein